MKRKVKKKRTGSLGVYFGRKYNRREGTNEIREWQVRRQKNTSTVKVPDNGIYLE